MQTRIKMVNNNILYIFPIEKKKEFLDYIGECPFDDYLYKWEVLEYKNRMPKNHQSKEKRIL